MTWFQRNFRSLLYLAFIIPILAVAFVSISHVTTWYGISNPMSWAIYLSIGIEIAALSALAAISADMGSKVYFPFSIVTLIQFIGNIFFAYQYIDVSGDLFKNWVELVDPLVSLIGVESGDTIGHKRFLALFSGGMLPLISLSFLHMLVKFEEERKKRESIVSTDKNERDDVVVEEKVDEVVNNVGDSVEEDVVIDDVKVDEVVNNFGDSVEEDVVINDVKVEDIDDFTDEENVIDGDIKVDENFKNLTEIVKEETPVEEVINFEPYYEEPVYEEPVYYEEDPVYYDEYEPPTPTPTQTSDGIKRLSYTKKYGE
jgi:hypothetical protein